MYRKGVNAVERSAGNVISYFEVKGMNMMAPGFRFMRQCRHCSDEQVQSMAARRRLVVSILKAELDVLVASPRGDTVDTRKQIARGFGMNGMKFATKPLHEVQPVMQLKWTSDCERVKGTAPTFISLEKVRLLLTASLTNLDLS
jgi:hypothetical protein